MADSRCANPEYQLEVDLMMVDYILYRAIQAHLRALKDISESILAPLSETSLLHTVVTEADRLLEIFDTLIKVFHHNHPDAALGESVPFNIRILQLLVLLMFWWKEFHIAHCDQASSACAHSFTSMSEQMVGKLEADRLVNIAYRRHWLSLRGEQVHHGAKRVAPLPHFRSGLDLIPSLTELTPRFMEVSEELSIAWDQDINDRWMRLATGLLLQSAIERLRMISQTLNQSDRKASLNEIEEWKTFLGECFAWGYVRRTRYETDISLVAEILIQLKKSSRDQKRLNDDIEMTNSGDDRLDQADTAALEARARLEDRLWEMFFQDGSGTTNTVATQTQPSSQSQQFQTQPYAIPSSSTPASSGEVPTWTTLLAQAQESIRSTLDLILYEAELDEVLIPVKLLAQKHPPGAFLKDMADYIGEACRVSWNPAPVLVQIEAGTLEGLDGEEFRTFVERCGLKWTADRGVDLG